MILSWTASMVHSKPDPVSSALCLPACASSHPSQGPSSRKLVCPQPVVGTPPGEGSERGHFLPVPPNLRGPCRHRGAHFCIHLCWPRSRVHAWVACPMQST